MAHLETKRDVPHNLFKVSKPLIGKVLESYRLTPPERPPWNDVRHVVLSSPGLTYLPGQSVGVIPDGTDPRTGNHEKLRLYSVASDSKGDYGDGQTVSVVVVRHFWDDEKDGKEGIPGICSLYLCDAEVGARVKLTGPVGKRFLLPTDFHDRDLLFLATGTGIAPYRGMLKEMFDLGYRGKTYLIFGVQFANTILYDEEFRSYLDRPNYRYVTALSREAEKNPFPDEIPTRNNKMYVQVRMWQLRDEIAESLAKPDTIVYVCGLKGMETGIIDVIDHVGQQIGKPGLAAEMKAEGRLLLEVY